MVGTATGEGSYDAGVETTTWIVALASAPDDPAVVLGAVADVPGVHYATAVDVLDAMAVTLTIGANDAG